ncbi:MAG TPA: hypothetical protein VFE50_22070 [Cyclobacteriaceae bacterium]|nr:hypothetical protein [Cyclobacteriaceae bacterium]
MEWIATILLWFVYLFMFVAAVSLTYAILASKRWISWVGLLFLPLAYTIVFGRWWDYDYAFIAFSIIFLVTKLYVAMSGSEHKVASWIDKISGKDERDKRKFNQ